MKSNLKNIVVIIPVYNEEASIEKCLNSLLNQSCKNLQIIVIDDGSSDKTVEIVTALSSAHKNIKLLTQAHKGPAQARNKAVSFSENGDILIFMDGDMTAHPDYIKKLVEPIISNSAKGTFTLEEYVGNTGEYLADTWSIAGGCEVGTRVATDHPEEQPVFRALLKSEFERVDGYSEKGEGAVGEDILLGEKLGYLAIAAPGAICYHNNPSTISDFFLSAAWYGKGWGFRKSGFNFLRFVIGRFPLISLIRRLLSGQFYYLPGLIFYDTALFYGAISTLFTNRVSK